MRNLRIALILMSISMILVGCNNEQSINKNVESNNISKEETVNENSNSNTSLSENITSLISEEKAKEIALNHSNLTSDQVTFGKTELDFDDGIQKYDIEFYYNNKEYSYEIDANTGDILTYEQD